MMGSFSHLQHPATQTTLINPSNKTIFFIHLSFCMIMPQSNDWGNNFFILPDKIKYPDHDS